MKKALIALLVACIICFPCAAMAEDVPVIVPITNGAPIPDGWDNKWPFDGAILNTPALAEIFAEDSFCKEECQLRISYEINKERARCDLLLDNANAHIDALAQQHSAIMAIKDDEIDRLTEMAIEDDYAVLWLAGGVLLGCLLSIGIVYSVSGAF